MVEGAMSERVRIPARHEAAARGTADRVNGEAVAEDYPLLRQPVHVRRLDRLTVDAMHGVRSQFIRHQEYEVRAFSSGRPF